MNFFLGPVIFIGFTGLVSTSILSRGKSVRSSSQFYIWEPSRIVDGDVGTDADVCQCCSATTQEDDPWYELDLGSNYTINRIHIQGRQDQKHNQHFDGMVILLKSVDDGISTNAETTVSGSVFNYDYQLSTPKSTRFVSLVLYSITRVFVVCELTVYGDCHDGEFGIFCENRCYCSGEPCNKDTGVCPSGACEPGYSGLYCNTECVARTFGSGCNETCGNCNNLANCDRKNGSCPGSCAPGYQGEVCKQECENGTYGAGCTGQCGFCLDIDVCDKTNGKCPDKCDPGYIGDLCQNKCLYGSYGMNCNEHCGNCLNDSPCFHTNGECTGGCKAGYKDLTCKTECMDGRYGLDCINQCGNCVNGTICNKISGICEAGCGPGYKQPYCKVFCDDNYYGDGCDRTCGNCKSGSVCDKVDGTCHGGCMDGYMSPLCTDECVNGSHGENCAEKCGQCLNGDPCNRFNGSCQGCEVDYGGHDCKTYVKADEQPGISAGILGGAIGSGVLIIGALIAAVVFLILRQRRNSFEKTGDTYRGKKSFEDIDLKGRSDEIRHVNEQEIESVYSTLDNDFDSARICQLWDYIRLKKKAKIAMLNQEFSRLKFGLQYCHDFACLPENKLKNIHKDVCSYDYNRVPVISEKNGESDYINASFINGIGMPRKFIASQGPNKDTRIDFLRMVWQQNSEIIVVLTDPIERNKKRYIVYWDEYNDANYGNMHVKLDSITSNNIYTVRKLRIRQNTERWRNITQYQFNVWPDKGVPDSTWSLVKFWRTVMSDVPSDSKPIVIHCSSGVGRTGTFIALDNAYNLAIAEDRVNVFKIVTLLREQRVNMVETEDQYVFLYEALADALLIGTRSVTITDFPEIYDYLMQMDLSKMVHRLQTQFQLIVESLEIGRNGEHVYESLDKTEYQNISLSSRQGTTAEANFGQGIDSDHYQLTEYDASYLQSFDGKESFILKRSPTRTTTFELQELLSLVKEKNIKTVVTLKDAVGQKDEINTGLQQSVGFDTPANGLKLIKESSWGAYSQQEFEFIGGDHCAIVSQFEYKIWQNNQPAPSDSRSVLAFLQEVMKWQQKLSDKQPVLVLYRAEEKSIIRKYLEELIYNLPANRQVQCNIRPLLQRGCTSIGLSSVFEEPDIDAINKCLHSHDAERPGLLCVLLNEICRMKSEKGHINIVESVKLMKEREKSIVSSYDQYKFIHDVILEACNEHIQV